MRRAILFLMPVQANRSRQTFRHNPACFSTISPNSDKSDRNTLHLIRKKLLSRSLVATLLTLLGTLAACEEPPSGPPAAATPEVPPKEESTCGNAGLLAGSLSGAINTELDWSDDELRCESMPRPDSAGVRLRFSGEISGERLAIIVALPTLEAGATGEAFDSNVTSTVEDRGRFFSTPNLGTCWSDIETNELLANQPVLFNVVGSLSCVAPLGEINGDAFVDLRDLRFSGIAAWTKQ